MFGGLQGTFGGSPQASYIHVKTRIYMYMPVYTLIQGVFRGILRVFCVFPAYYLGILCILAKMSEKHQKASGSKSD